ncbi:extensin-like [Papaver somniferum]|uniref:extensin-like n=1 Tax=Papaver somniferum TaxID=3469 RepID=UPI000E703653|nr:extensin-like [Papaver somniferum]
MTSAKSMAAWFRVLKEMFQRGERFVDLRRSEQLGYWKKSFSLSEIAVPNCALKMERCVIQLTCMSPTDYEPYTPNYKETPYKKPVLAVTAGVYLPEHEHKPKHEYKYASPSPPAYVAPMYEYSSPPPHVYVAPKYPSTKYTPKYVYASPPPPVYVAPKYPTPTYTLKYTYSSPPPPTYVTPKYPTPTYTPKYTY